MTRARASLAVLALLAGETAAHAETYEVCTHGYLGCTSQFEVFCEDLKRDGHLIKRVAEGICKGKGFSRTQIEVISGHLENFGECGDNAWLVICN